MGERRCLYEVLGCSRDASEDELRRAYKKEALKHHPDRNAGDAGAEARFKAVNEAYSVLSDAQKREIYNQYGFEGLEGGYGQGGMGDVVSHMQDLFNEMFGGGFGFGGGGRRRNGPQRGSDLQVGARLTLREAAFGCKREFTLRTPAPCDDCQGSGAAKGSEPERCGQCRGSGQVSTARGFVMFSSTCPSCHGQGSVVKNPCKSCHGKGAVERERTVQVSFPAGVDSGQRLRVGGQGMAGSRGGPPGDLYVDIDVLEDPQFERDGADLAVHLDVSLVQAALGAELQVPILAPEGEPQSHPIQIPAGTQPGAVIPLRELGLPRLNGRGRGTLAVVVRVQVPKNLSPRAKELLQALGEELASETARAAG